MGHCQIVLRGRRVADPESAFDAVADVAIGGGRVIEISVGLLTWPDRVRAGPFEQTWFRVQTPSR
jgi:hypothetical protein